jgi:REP element-mobilizing transposase RayT
MLQAEDHIILEQQGCSYLTLNAVDWIDIFIRPVYKQVIVESLNYFIDKKGLTVYAWCLMTNHLHLVVQANQGYGLSSLINDLKKFTSRLILEDIDVEPDSRRKWMLEKFRNASNSLKLMEKFQVWQTSINPVYIDLNNSSSVKSQLDYVHCNPVRDRIVMLPEDYLYSSASDYAGMKGLVNVQLITEKQEPDFLLRHLSSYRNFH